jgi:FlgD Ig-like domain
MSQSGSGRHRSDVPARHEERQAPPRDRGSVMGRRALGATAALALAVGGAGAALHFSDLGGHKSASLAASTTSVPMLGSSVYSPSDLAADTQAFGHMPIVRVYYPGLPPANAWTSGLAGANHSAVIVSFKALPTTILSGADDPALKQFFDSAPTGHPVYWSFYHEPEDNIAAGQFTLADYKAAWAHIAQLAQAANNPDLTATLILMEYDLQPASHRNWKDYLPGGNIIKVLGWDAYPLGSATGTNPQIQPPADFMAPAIAASKSVGLPYGFAEFALDLTANRAPWLSQVGQYLMTSGALFGTYFNGNAQYPAMQLNGTDSASTWHTFVQEALADLGGAPPASSASPTSAPTSTAAPSPTTSAPSASPGISGLAVDPATLTPNGTDDVGISFTLGQAADVTVCILNADNAVVQQISKPGRPAGRVTVPYYGFDGKGHHIPAGNYTVLIVASNSQGSSTAEGGLTITP